MTLTIELTEEEERGLQALAQEQGLELAEFAHQLLAKEVKPERAWGARVLAELEQEGVFGMWKDRSEPSPEIARQLRERAQRRLHE